MREPNHDDDPFRKVQEDLKNIDFEGIDQDADLQAKVKALLDQAAAKNNEDEQFERIAADSLQDKVSQAASAPLPNTDEFEESFRKLEAKAKMVKGKRDTQERAIAEERKIMRSDARGMGIGLTLAYIIVGVPMAGAAVGWVIDAQTGSNVFKGMGALTGAVIGIGLALFLMNRPNPKP